MALTLTSRWRGVSWQRKAVVVLVSVLLLILLTILQMTPDDFISAEITATTEKCAELTEGGNTSSNRAWPRIIHQTWKDRDVPEKYRGFQESCRALNPDYKYMFWTDDELETLIKKHYPWFVATLNTYPYKIQKIDAARLFLLDHFGGAYLDIDLKCNIQMKTIYEDAIRTNPNAQTILAATKPLGITNNFLISKPGVPFMRYLTRRLLETRGSHYTPYWTVMFSTGPLFVYRSYMAYPCKQHIHIMTEQQHSHEYFTHGHAGSWHTWEGPVLKFFDNNGRMLLQIVVVLVTVVLFQQLYKQIRTRMYTVKEPSNQNIEYHARI